MYKKLLGLLPLVWVAALAPHFLAMSRLHAADGQSLAYGRSPVAFMPQQAIYHRMSPADLTMGLKSDGCKVKDISVDCMMNDGRPQFGQRVDFRTLNLPTAKQYTIVRLSATSLSLLPNGMRHLRFTMDDGTFADYQLLVDASTGRRQRFASGDERYIRGTNRKNRQANRL